MGWVHQALTPPVPTTAPRPAPVVERASGARPRQREAGRACGTRVRGVGGRTSGIPSQTQWRQDAQELRLQAPGASSSVLWSALQVRFKAKTIKNFKVATAEHQTQVRGPFGSSALCAVLATQPNRQACVIRHTKAGNRLLVSCTTSALAWCSENKRVLAWGERCM